jgi:hypothetical protein
VTIDLVLTIIEYKHLRQPVDGADKKIGSVDLWILYSYIRVFPDFAPQPREVIGGCHGNPYVLRSWLAGLTVLIRRLNVRVFIEGMEIILSGISFLFLNVFRFSIPDRPHANLSAA